MKPHAPKPHSLAHSAWRNYVHKLAHHKNFRRVHYVAYLSYYGFVCLETRGVHLVIVGLLAAIVSFNHLDEEI
jgi:retron-type reverse transcriptase